MPKKAGRFILKYIPKFELCISVYCVVYFALILYVNLYGNFVRAYKENITTPAHGNYNYINRK